MPSMTLLSDYRIHRDADGHLVLMMPWPARPLIGCAAPVAIVAIGVWLIPTFHTSSLYGFAFMSALFAALVIPIIIYQSSHAWVLSRGFIKPATALGPRYWPRSEWLDAQSVVLRRELWPGGRGSTDKVLVATSSSTWKVVTVYNWAGHESRLASGGMGSLARSGPTVPTAPEPLAATADANLKLSVSEAIREITDLVALELGVPLNYVSGYARQSPDDVD